MDGWGLIWVCPVGTSPPSPRCCSSCCSESTRCLPVLLGLGLVTYLTSQALVTDAGLALAGTGRIISLLHLWQQQKKVCFCLIASFVFPGAYSVYRCSECDLFLHVFFNQSTGTAPPSGETWLWQLLSLIGS